MWRDHGIETNSMEEEEDEEAESIGLGYLDVPFRGDGSCFGSLVVSRFVLFVEKVVGTSSPCSVDPNPY